MRFEPFLLKIEALSPLMLFGLLVIMSSKGSEGGQCCATGRRKAMRGPANAREPPNVIERMAILPAGERLRNDAIPGRYPGAAEAGPNSMIQKARESAEREHILMESAWNLLRLCARPLGLKRTSLDKRIRARAKPKVGNRPVVGPVLLRDDSDLLHVLESLLLVLQVAPHAQARQARVKDSATQPSAAEHWMPPSSRQTLGCSSETRERPMSAMPLAFVLLSPARSCSHQTGGNGGGKVDQYSSQPLAAAVPKFVPTPYIEVLIAVASRTVQGNRNAFKL